MAENYLSIVIPVFNEEGNLKPLHDQICESLDLVGKPSEIIFIDDHSTDSSQKILKEIADKDSRVKVIFFPRNFGQTAAIAAGIDYSTGEVIVTMDADLQNDPRDIPRLLEKLKEGFDVVSGWRKDRKDRFITRKIPSITANWLISAITGVKLRDYGCTLKAYRSDLIKEVHLYGEMHRFIPALTAWLGASVTEIPVLHRPRTTGSSKYGLFRTFKVLLDLVTVKFMGSFSTKPIYVFGGGGILLLFGGFISGAALIYLKLFEGEYMIRSPLLQLTALLLTLGVQLILIGLLAEIVVRTYFESQKKSTYIVKETINIDDPVILA